jgi:hypothetical protein
MAPMILVRNVDELKGEVISKGVTQRLLLEKAKSASGKLAVSTIEIQPWCEYGPIDYEGEMVYYVLNGYGNLAYAPGGQGELTNILCDWNSDSYSYIAPKQRHSMSDQGQAPLNLLRVEYEATHSPDSIMPWGVPIFRRNNPVRVDHSPGCISTVNQTPQTLRPMGVEHFRAVEYEIVHKAPKPEIPPPKPPEPDAKEEKSRDEIVNFVVRGKGKYLIGGKQYPVRAGSLIYSSPSGVIDVNPTKLVDVEQYTLEFLYFCIRI